MTLQLKILQLFHCPRVRVTIHILPYRGEPATPTSLISSANSPLTHPTPTILASVLPLVASGRTPGCLDSRLTAMGMFPCTTRFLFSLFLLFAFIQGLLGVGTVLHNKTIGSNCGTPVLRKPRWRNQSSIKVII